MSGEGPSVAVIIPCYNREKFVRETIDSALSQIYPNIEIVVVDDGSTDGTRKILDSYGDRIRVLEHPGGVNRGQSAAINLGIRSSQSEYVAILDSDDVWATDKIEKQVRFIENNPHIGLVYSNGYAIDARGNKLYKLYRNGHRETGSPERVLLECQFACPSGYLVRGSVLEKAGEFDEDLRSAQDHDMAIRLAEITRVAYLDEKLWFYRRHADSLSGKHARRRWENGFKILRKACRRHHYGWNVLRRRLAVLHFRLGQCLLQEGKSVRAMGRMLMAGMLDPIRGFKVLMGLERITGPH